MAGVPTAQKRPYFDVRHPARTEQRQAPGRADVSRRETVPAWHLKRVEEKRRFGRRFGHSIDKIDANGNYQFANAGPRLYMIAEIVKSGWKQTTDNPAPFVMQSGTAINNQLFGNKKK